MMSMMKSYLLIVLISSASAFAPSSPSLVVVSSNAAAAARKGMPSSSSALAAMDPSTIAGALGISEDLAVPAAVATLGLVISAAVAAGASSSGGGGSTAVSSVPSGPPAEKINYDAAAQLAYENDTPPATRSLPAYEKYKNMYKEKSVAEVKIKVLQRKVAALSEEMKALNDTA